MLEKLDVAYPRSMPLTAKATDYLDRVGGMNDIQQFTQEFPGFFLNGLQFVLFSMHNATDIAGGNSRKAIVGIRENPSRTMPTRVHIRVYLTDQASA